MALLLSGKLLASRVYPEYFRLSPDGAVLHAGCGDGAQILAYGERAGKRVICADIQKDRVAAAVARAKNAGIVQAEGIVADLERLSFPDGTFDAVVAIDVIQHVQRPEKVLAEFRRVLKIGGELLVTFPALQHYWLTRISKLKRAFFSPATRGVEEEGESVHMQNTPHQTSPQGGEDRKSWNPDAFNHNAPLSEWMRVGAVSGLQLVRSHATTLFPPLHRYGIPRFWFSSDLIHRIDYFFGGLPVLKRLGQAMMCVYRKRETCTIEHETF